MFILACLQCSLHWISCVGFIRDLFKSEKGLIKTIVIFQIRNLCEDYYLVTAFKKRQANVIHFYFKRQVDVKSKYIAGVCPLKLNNWSYSIKQYSIQNTGEINQRWLLIGLLNFPLQFSGNHYQAILLCSWKTIEMKMPKFTEIFTRNIVQYPSTYYAR